MRNKEKLHLNWKWQIHSTPSQIWPYISDTNKLFKDLKLPSVQPTPVSYEASQNHLQLSYDSFQFTDVWIEEPYQWEFPFRYGVKRKYKNGVYKKVKIQVDLYPNQKGTVVHYQLWLEPRNSTTSFLSTIQLKTIHRKRIKDVIKSYDEFAKTGNLPYRYKSRYPLSIAARKRLEQAKTELKDATGKEVIISKLVDYILRADDIDLAVINPYALAGHWNEERGDVLHVFLHAVKKGLLNFNWDLHCPECRTIQKTCRTLNEIHEPIFCSGCKKEFKVNFNHSIQLSFQPNPLIRKISADRYCLGGPHTKPHILIQQYLEAGQKYYVKTRLEEGLYYMRTYDPNNRMQVRVSKKGQHTVSIRLSTFGLGDEDVEIYTEPNLTFENNSLKDQMIILEKAEWSHDILPAAHVTSLQVFRDLFTHEVLQKGQKIAVDNLTLMFTDLFDSTRMYKKEGDDQAIDRVIEHFEVLQQIITEENGAIVKTIGDSVMAVFSKPVHAFTAFVRAQEIISKDKRFGDSLKIKAGIHYGRCMAVNLNNKIDYFGSTVNIASRLVDQANQNEVILSENVWMDSEVAELFNSKLGDFFSDTERTGLKGFDQEIFTLKRIRLEQTALRLVI